MKQRPPACPDAARSMPDDKRERPAACLAAPVYVAKAWKLHRSRAVTVGEPSLRDVQATNRQRRGRHAFAQPAAEAAPGFASPHAAAEPGPIAARRLVLLGSAGYGGRRHQPMASMVSRGTRHDSSTGAPEGASRVRNASPPPECQRRRRRNAPAIRNRRGHRRARILRFTAPRAERLGAVLTRSFLGFDDPPHGTRQGAARDGGNVSQSARAVQPEGGRYTHVAIAVPAAGAHRAGV